MTDLIDTICFLFLEAIPYIVHGTFALSVEYPIIWIGIAVILLALYVFIKIIMHFIRLIVFLACIAGGTYLLLLQRVG